MTPLYGVLTEPESVEMTHADTTKPWQHYPTSLDSNFFSTNTNQTYKRQYINEANQRHPCESIQESTSGSFAACMHL